MTTHIDQEPLERTSTIGITPLGTRVVVQLQVVRESISQGGVVLPQTHEVSAHKAEVLEIGDEVYQVSPGELVLLSLGVGDHVEYRQDHYVIVDVADILAILERD